jgi:hypothetical protein
MVRRLCKGATLDADEQTLIQILAESKKSNDHVPVIDGVGAHLIALNTHGDEWKTLHAFYKSHYYTQTSPITAFRMIITCLNGETAEWEEEMVADLLCLRSDGGDLLSKIGRHYEGGGRTEGLMKIEWQLDGGDQKRVETVHGSSGYYFGDSAIRDRINKKSNGELDELGTNEKSAMVSRLIEGSCTNDDEDVVLKLLRASIRSGDLIQVVDATGAYSMAYSTDGDQWQAMKKIFRSHYYPRCSASKVFDMVKTCLDGETAEWEEEMVSDVLWYRRSGDGRDIIARIGKHYSGGGFKDGLNKLEWQLDGADQDWIEKAYGTSGRFW